MIAMQQAIVYLKNRRDEIVRAAEADIYRGQYVACHDIHWPSLFMGVIVGGMVVFGILLFEQIRVLA